MKYLVEKNSIRRHGGKRSKLFPEMLVKIGLRNHKTSLFFNIKLVEILLCRTLGNTWWDKEENGGSSKASSSFNSLLADLRKDTPSNKIGLFKE